MSKTKIKKIFNKKSFQHFSNLYIKNHKILNSVDIEGYKGDSQISKNLYHKESYKMENESFHSAIGPVLILSQTLFVMPIYGALDKDFRKIEFIWISIRTFLALFLIIFAVISSILINIFYIKLGITLDSIGTMLFYNLAAVSAIILFSLGRKWKKIIYYWSKQEYVFLRSPYKIKGWKLSTKINFVVFSMFLLCVCKIHF